MSTQEEYGPERALIAAIVRQAVDDARMPAEGAALAREPETHKIIADAFDFLFTDRINWFAETLDLDVDAIREALLVTQFRRCTMHEIPLTKDRDRENRKRHNFRENYERYRESISIKVH